MKLQIIDAKTNEKLRDFDLVSTIRNNRKCVIGRSATSNLILENSDISRSHGEFTYESGEYYFTDTGSSNGSLINNEIAAKNHPYLFQAGDKIRLGDFLLISQSTAGVRENATVIGPTLTSSSNTAKSNNSEIPFLPETKLELAQPKDVKQANINSIPSEESCEDFAAKITDVGKASAPRDVTKDTVAEIPVPAEQSKQTTILQESILPATTADSDTTDIAEMNVEKPVLQKESHTDTTTAEEIVEKDVVMVADKLVPEKVARASTVKESRDSFIPAADTLTENVEAEEAQLTENTYVQTSVPEFIDSASTEETVSLTNEATNKKFNEHNDISSIPEILKEKYIVLLAHDNQKEELANFILHHKATFSNCLLMASSAISEILEENDIFVKRELSSLSKGGYQEVNSEIRSGNLLGVIFLRDFIQQSSQENDEALSRTCNINQVILATNIATARAFEGYLQHSIASIFQA